MQSSDQVSGTRLDRGCRHCRLHPWLGEAALLEQGIDLRILAISHSNTCKALTTHADNCCLFRTAKHRIGGGRHSFVPHTAKITLLGLEKEIHSKYLPNISMFGKNFCTSSVTVALWQGSHNHTQDGIGSSCIPQELRSPSRCGVREASHIL